MIDTASPKRFKVIRILSLISSLLIASQIAIILINGTAVCPNAGCTVVERLTVVSPLIFNLVGLLYFLSIFWISGWSGRRPGHYEAALSFLLLAGLAAEGVFLGYQFFVAQAMCSYCLTVFACVLALNLAAGLRQLVSGVAALTAVVAAFSLLVFLPVQVRPENYSFKLGTYAVRTCAAPSKEIFLLFSSECPHCQNVIRELENCNSCELNLNPIDKIEHLDLAGVQRRAGYSPQVNRLMLALFGIDQVPVLVVKSSEGYSFVKGEKNIINYIRVACFQQEPVMFLPHAPGTGRRQDITLFSEDDQNCSLDISCEDENTGERDTLTPQPGRASP